MIPLPELLLPLPADALTRLLTAFGPLSTAPQNATHTELVRWLFTHPAASPSSFSSASASSSAPAPHRLPRDLVTAVASTLPNLGTRSGRRAICEAARAVGDPRAVDWLEVTSVEPAIELIVEAATAKKRATRDRARLLLQLARLRTVRDLPPRATYELLGTRPIERDPERIERLLRRALGKKLEEIWPVVDPDGTVRLAVFVRRPVEGTFELSPRPRKEPAHRPRGRLACDHVCIAADGSRVRITPSMPETLPEYVSAFGLSLNPSLTLRPLLDLVRETLATVRVASVTQVEVVGMRVRRPNGSRVEARGADRVDPSYVLPAGGYVDRATLRITVNGTSKVDAFIQLPHHFDISDRSFEAELRAGLEALGLFTPGRLPDDARSLSPYEHGEWRWIAVLGEAAFARLKALNFFTRVKAAHVVTKEMRMHGAAYVVHEVPGRANTWYALAEDPSLGARLVTAEDRVAYRLEIDRLRGAMMRDLGATEADLPLGVPGIVDLGVVTLASGRLRFVYAMGEPQVGWAEALRRACGLGVTPVVLVPRGHGGNIQGILAIELDVHEQFGARGVGRALGRAAEALGVGNEVAAWLRYDEELVLDRSAKQAWLLGVALILSENGWKFVEYLATHAGKVVPTNAIGRHVSISADPGAAARRTKSDVEQQVSGCLERSGADTAIVERLIVAEGHKGYRLGVTVRAV